MTDPAEPRRVVVWSTGGIGSAAIRTIHQRADLALVGVWVHDPGKVGRDAGDLAGISPLGITATDDAGTCGAVRCGRRWESRRATAPGRPP